MTSLMWNLKMLTSEKQRRVVTRRDGVKRCGRLGKQWEGEGIGRKAGSRFRVTESSNSCSSVLLHSRDTPAA